MKENRIYIVQSVIILVALIYVIRLFDLQILDTEYKEKAERNKSKKRVVYPYRGAIYDREGRLLVYSEPVFDLMMTWKDVTLKDTTRFCDIVGITKAEFDKKILEFRNEKGFSYRKIKPQPFLTQISSEELAKMMDRFDFNGFSFQAKMGRSYPHTHLANSLGYLAQISKKQLERDTVRYYQQGDFIGKSGIEGSYEKFLRGKKGIEYIKVNAKGVEAGSYEDGRYDSAAVAGQNLQSTIDLELQAYGELLMQNKVGSIVAIEPTTGEILAMVSSPSYDPNLLTGREYSTNYQILSSDQEHTPLVNRPIQSKYPPGSTFKVVQGLIALQEKVITPYGQVYCNSSVMGDHAPVGYYDVRRAIKLSSNRFFYEVMKRMVQKGVVPNRYEDAAIGLDKWKAHMNSFGLGEKLGIDIFNEVDGLIPGAAYYDNIYKGKGTWKYSNIYSLSIGQGEIQITPLQLANLSAIVANHGYFYTPHLIRGMHQYKKRYTTVDSSYFKYAIDGMQDVVESGTARRAIVPGITVCGKTGTVENKTKGVTYAKDHSVFMAFAPRENPKIAISVYVENSGNYGGTWAAPISALMIEKYLTGEINNKYKEQRILDADFVHFEEKPKPITPTPVSVAVPVNDTTVATP